MAGEGVRGFFLAFESDSKGFGSYQAGGRPLGGRFGECSDVGGGVVRTIWGLARPPGGAGVGPPGGLGLDVPAQATWPRGLRWRV